MPESRLHNIAVAAKEKAAYDELIDVLVTETFDVNKHAAFLSSLNPKQVKGLTILLNDFQEDIFGGMSIPA